MKYYGSLNIGLIFHSRCLGYPVFVIINSATMNVFIFVYLFVCVRYISRCGIALFVERMFKILLYIPGCPLKVWDNFRLPPIVSETFLFPTPSSILDITKFLLIDKKHLRLKILIFLSISCVCECERKRESISY